MGRSYSKRRHKRRKMKRAYASSNSSWRSRKRQAKRRQILRILLGIATCALFGTGVVVLIDSKDVLAGYETQQYGKGVYQEGLPVDELCVVKENVQYSNYQSSEVYRNSQDFHAAAVFSINTSDTVYAENVHEKIYPASTTKILTAYVAIKYGELTDVVTVGKNAVNVPSDSSKAWLKQGDKLTLEDLLYALMLPSGNDAAVAIAEHISGSEEAFVELMNQEAKKMGATNTHFVTPHGYQDEEHYTTAYDLYLMFNKCIQEETFLKVVSSYAYETEVTESNGSTREVIWRQSNQYVTGVQAMPKGIDVVGGKTGTTDEAGACLIQYVKDKEDGSFVSMIMGAENRPVLYQNMTELLSTLAN